MNGLFLIDKMPGQTSREIDDYLKKIFSLNGVGHLGTLDPFASGLLIIGINEGTRVFPFLEEEKKTYEATLLLGERTDTGDNLGKVMEKKTIPHLDKETIEKTFRGFLGKQKQLPPQYSAKHIDGKRAYDLAREGIKVELKEQDIEIYSLELISFNGNEISFQCQVSKGTYIRVLGEDIAQKLGTVGHLISLRRTKIGAFDVSQAKRMDEVSKKDIIPLIKCLPESETLFVDDKTADKAMNGIRLELKGRESKYAFLCNDIGKPLAIYEKKGDQHVCLRGFGSIKTKVLTVDKEGIKEERPGKPTSIAIGEFDGIHLGHQQVLAKLAHSKFPKYVLLFTKDFKTRIRNLPLDYLMEDKEKIRDFTKLGFLDGVLVIPYDEKIVRWSPDEFIDKVLRPLKVKEIDVGKDFSFGYQGKGKVADLVRAGFKVHPLELETSDNTKISTTKIKDLIRKGDIATANKLLGHYYTFTGIVVHGFENGRKIGFPTANMIPEEGRVIPGNGVYKTYALYEGKIYHSMTNVGIHPTIQQLVLPIIETTLLDGFNGDLYDKEVKVIFERKIRDEVKFDSLKELIEKIKKDELLSCEGEIDFKIGEYPFL